MTKRRYYLTNEPGKELLDYMTPSVLLEMLAESAHSGLDMDSMHNGGYGGMMDDYDGGGCHGSSGGSTTTSTL